MSGAIVTASPSQGCCLLTSAGNRLTLAGTLRPRHPARMRVHFFHERPRVAAELIDGRGLGEQMKGGSRRESQPPLQTRPQPASGEDPLEDQARRQVV
jgi:hypothetical protein